MLLILVTSSFVLKGFLNDQMKTQLLKSYEYGYEKCIRKFWVGENDVAFKFHGGKIPWSCQNEINFAVFNPEYKHESLN